MMRSVWMMTSSLLISTVVVGNEADYNYVEGYCWRDFNGYIPSDALPGGKDKYGQTTYIGQALHPGGFITPGWIARGSDKVSYESALKQHFQSLGAKILCAQDPERFIWFSNSNKHSVQDLNNNRLVIGGQDSSGLTPVGRIAKDTEVIVGKVTIVDGKLDEIYYALEGTSFKSASFEVLLFNTTTGNRKHLECNHNNQHVTINFFSDQKCNSQGCN